MGKWSSIYQDILHIYFSPYYRELPEMELVKIAPNSLGKRLKIIVKQTYLRCLKLFRTTIKKDKIELLNDRVWLFALSQNNKQTLDFIHEAMPDSIFVLDKPRKEFDEVEYIVPNLRFLIIHIFKYGVLFLTLVNKHGDYARRLSSVIFKSVGFYEEWKRILCIVRPKAIIFSNDHNIESRSLLLAAKAFDIPTIYIQHASISSSFPPLKFSLSLLEGQDAFDKYAQIGQIEGEVQLVGMPKFDHFLKYRRLNNLPPTKIGIPFNMNDSNTMLLQLIKHLHDRFPAKIITIRRHPKDKRPDELTPLLPYVKNSNPLEQSPFEFLMEQDVIIAGNSSIHLEATLLNLPSIYFNLNPGTFIDDYYGYVKNDLVPMANNIEEVAIWIDLLKNQSVEVFERARFYNSIVGTKMEGCSQKLVVENIKKFLQK